MEFISQLCVLILLQDTRCCSPDYIREKMAYLDAEPQTAFAALDWINQRKVMNYLRHWQMTIPEWMAKNV